MRLLIRSVSSLVLIAWGSAAAFALEDGGQTSMAWDQASNAERLDIGRLRAFSSPETLDPNRTEIWSTGLSKSDPRGAGLDSEKTLGAKLRPFEDLDLLIGTEMNRSLDLRHALQSKVEWELAWSGRWSDAKSLEIGLSTTGSLDNSNAAYAQSAGGSFGIPLLPGASAWSTQLLVSPTVSLDTGTGAWTSNLRSEIVTSREFAMPGSPFQSVVNVRMAYDVAPAARPAASATLELRISPKS